MLPKGVYSMKNIKKYYALNVTLSIILSLSFYTFAMEPIKGSNSSGESIPIEGLPSGISSESGESGVEINSHVQRILETRINTLNHFNQKLKAYLKNVEISRLDEMIIKNLQGNIRATIQIAYQMSFGDRLVDIPYLNQETNKIEVSGKKYW